jgi:hypothetical protein
MTKTVGQEEVDNMLLERLYANQNGWGVDSPFTPQSHSTPVNSELNLDNDPQLSGNEQNIQNNDITNTLPELEINN